MGTLAQVKLLSACRLKKTGKLARRGFGWSSGNWSGYALAGQRGAFRRISANWTVPALKPSPSPSYSSAWIGIDGFRNNSLIQTGTGHEIVNGKPHYYAWWEILPAAETVIHRPVYPGDRMRALIAKRKGSIWEIMLKNVTRNWCFRTFQRYNGPQASAEWIVEAPQIGGSTTRLARLCQVKFSCCRVNGRNPRLTKSQGGVMIQNGVAVSVPCRPNKTRDGFVVRRPAAKA